MIKKIFSSKSKTAVVIVSILLSSLGYMKYQQHVQTLLWEFEVKEFKRGIKNDNPLALYALGKAYHTGQGLPIDNKRAILLYKKAANKGEAIAQYSMGRMYEAGEVVKPDLQEAYYYYAQAAMQYYSPALSKLSEMYSQGVVVKQDAAKANILKQQSEKHFGKSLHYTNHYKIMVLCQLGHVIETFPSFIERIMESIFYILKHDLALAGYNLEVEDFLI
jgi:TPR repeat protein